jgi:hypothetical protein
MNRIPDICPFTIFLFMLKKGYILYNKIMHDKKILHICFWIWFVVVSIFSVLPTTPGPDVKMKVLGLNFRLDYFEHFIEFAILAFIFFQRHSLRNISYKCKIRQGIMFIIVISAFAFGSEYIQTLIPDRSFNMMDFYSNTTGILIIAVFFIYKYIRRDVYF